MEKKQIAFPITEENFDQAWAYVDEKRRKAIVRKWVRRVASAVGNLIFFLLMCIAVFGYYRNVEGPHFQGFLRSLPILPDIWYRVSAQLFPPERAVWGKIAGALGMLHLIPFALGAVSGGIVGLCCRPKAKPVPGGTAQENALALYTEAERLILEGKRQHLSNNTWYVVLFMVYAFGLIIAFMLKLAFGGESELLMEIYMQMQLAFVFVVALWAIYGFLNYLLLQLMRLLYVLKLPEELETGTHNHLLRSDPVRKAQLEEEDRILALAEEIKARRKKEREERMKK